MYDSDEEAGAANVKHKKKGKSSLPGKSEGRATKRQKVDSDND